MSGVFTFSLWESLWELFKTPYFSSLAPAFLFLPFSSARRLRHNSVNRSCFSGGAHRVKRTGIEHKPPRSGHFWRLCALRVSRALRAFRPFFFAGRLRCISSAKPKQSFGASLKPSCIRKARNHPKISRREVLRSFCGADFRRDEGKRRREYFVYCQGVSRNIGGNLPAKTGLGSAPVRLLILRHPARRSAP